VVVKRPGHDEFEMITLVAQTELGWKGLRNDKSEVRVRQQRCGRGQVQNVVATIVNGKQTCAKYISDKFNNSSEIVEQERNKQQEKLDAERVVELSDKPNASSAAYSVVDARHCGPAEAQFNQTPSNGISHQKVGQKLGLSDAQARHAQAISRLPGSEGAGPIQEGGGTDPPEPSG